MNILKKKPRKLVEINGEELGAPELIRRFGLPFGHNEILVNPGGIVMIDEEIDILEEEKEIASDILCG
jgi:hypothetical protein